MIDRVRLLVLMAPALGAALCAADIYGYVDEQGVAHLSNTPLGERYILFRKEPQQEAPPQAPPPATPPPEVTVPERGAIAALRKHYAQLVARVAREQQLDASLLHAVITVESGYNAGEGAVMNYSNTIPPYAETRSYVPRVLRHYERYRAGPSL